MEDGIPNQALEVSLRVLRAYTSRTYPAVADEVFLRALTGDVKTPSDELACQVIQAELRKLREQRRLKAMQVELLETY